MKDFNDEATAAKATGFIVAAAAAYLFSVGYAIAVHRPFFADGSHYFLKILEERNFIYADDFARHFAHYITQFIPVLLIRTFHVTSLSVLSFAFGLGLYLPQIVGLAICLLIVRRHDMRLILFPVVALFGISANMSFLIAHESHVIANIFWPILFYVVLVDKFRWHDVIILVPLTVIFTRCYESAAILGTILVFAAGAALVGKWYTSSAGTKAVRVLVIVILFIGVLIAVRSIFYPRCPENKTAFLSSFASILMHWPALLSSFYIAAISLCMLLPNFARSSFFRVAAAALTVCALFVGLIPVLAPNLTKPSLQYDARVYVAYMLPLLSIPAYLVLRGTVRVPDFAWKKIVPLVLMLVIAQTTWQILATSQWAGFRDVFKNELKMHQGYVRFQDTSLAEEKVGLQLLNPMVWPWTNSTLSILWAPGQDVGTIISSASGDVEHFLFDPQKPDELPKVEEFGFTFERYREELNKGKERGPAKDRMSG